jgi:class 3 adenylate cyclase/tetratricopeptide (TPR) repeat protein
MSEREELEQAMAALDRQRTVLGDAAVEAALAGLRQKLAALDEHEPAPSTLAGERRVVTILFCDVKGSTSMAGQLDPEEWAGIMKRAFAYLISPVTRYDGTVARLMGDAILAFFGAPTAHEDDALRAVRAGLDIIEGINIFREQIQRERGLDFNVRVGINTGLVFVGAIGSGQRVEYTAVGDTINLVARMEQTARPGSVQITEQTYQLVKMWFEFEALGGIQVKGKSEPVLAYCVLGVKARPGRGRGLEGQGLSSPLVGRENELNAVKSLVERLSSTGEGSIVAIIGEAGLGKSRLIAEVHTSITNVLWLEGSTLSFGQTISYWPFQQILRGWAGITEDDDADTTWSKLESHVGALVGAESGDYLPYLASLLALEVRGEYVERVKYLDGDALGKQIFLTSRRFFERLARTRPVALVFEDLHWMDESSTNLLEHLLPLVESMPLLIIGLSRPERNTPAARLRELCARDYIGRYTEIPLAPLSDADSTQLIRNLLEIENLPARLRELIVKKAEGNPFFLEEVIRTLIDTGMVVRDSASRHWRATAEIESFHIPDTIQGVIIARVDRLDEEVKQVLRVASVIGRSFLYRVLKAITEAGQRLDDSLSELQQTELIHEKQATPELEYIFKHALAQEATYESILLQKRRELHDRVAQAIESLFAERLEEFYGLLAYHYARAEAWDKAQAYLLKAGDQAGRLAADAEALSLYQQALEAYARAFGDQWDPLQRAALERKMGEAFFRRGEYPRAVEHFRRALIYFGYQLPMSHWQVRRALLRELIVQMGHRLLPGFFLKSAAELIAPSMEDEAFIYEYTAYIDSFTNSERFLLLTLRLLNFSERRGYLLGIVLSSEGLGIALDFLGLFRQAEWYHHSGVAVAEKLRLPYALGSAYAGLQVHEAYMGELAQSLVHGRRSAQDFHDAWNLVEWGLPTAYWSFASVQRGDFAEALASSKELIRVGQDAGARALWCWGETILGSALRRQGQLQEAIACLQKALELAEAIPDYSYQVIARGDLGLCYLRQGNWQAALAELETCRRVGAEYHVSEPGGRVMMLNNLAEAYVFAAEHGDTSERAIWLNKARRACQTAIKASSACQIKVPKALRLQGTYEWLNGKPAKAQKWWQKSLVEANRMGLRYDVGMINLEIGQRLGEREHLEKAEAIFAEIGAQLDLARTRELLGR